MKLPNGERAVVSDDKLLRYLLNADHDEGRHHAHLFELLLGINERNAEVLRDELRRAALEVDATIGKPSEYGQKYEVRFEMTGPRARYTVLSVWFVPTGSQIPHLVTVYVISGD